MKPGRRTFLGAAIAALGCGVAAPQAAASGRSRPDIEALAAAARAQLKAPGLAYGLIRDNQVDRRRGLGVRQLDGNSPITPQTLFHMASVVKPFVATVIAQRVERGRLRLDQPVAEVVPEFRPDDARARSITIEQLLTHSSGLEDVTDFHWDQPETDAGALQRYIQKLSHTRLLFAPGESFSYSDNGYDLLARVIEVVDGVPFETAMRQALFEPLKMSHTTLFYPEADPAQLATPHVRDAQGVIRASTVFPYNRPHAGSSTLLSCIDDMLRWLQFNLNGGILEGTRILSPQTVLAMRSPRRIEVRGDGYPPGMKIGLSWFRIMKGGHVIFAHPGSDLGFNSLCLFCPDRRYGLVAMANVETDHVTLRNFAFAAIDAGLLDPG